MTDVLEQLKEESLRLARGSFDSVDCGLAANVADAAIEEIERLRGLTFNDAQGSLTQEDIYANCWTTLIGFSEELTERDRKFICDQVARKVILAAQPPAAPVETKSAPAAPTGDTQSGERPPASAAMGHSAGAGAQCSAETSGQED
jgi:hypothetical protein